MSTLEVIEPSHKKLNPPTENNIVTDSPNTLAQQSPDHGQLSNDATHGQGLRSSNRKISKPKKFLPDEYNSAPCPKSNQSKGKRKCKKIDTTPRAPSKRKKPRRYIPATCPTCNKYFLSTESLIKHRKLHLNQSFKCQEPSCGKIYKTLRYLQAHKVRMHLNLRIPCTFCPIVLKSKDNLRKHIRRRHQEGNDFKCNEPGCNKTFSTGLFLKSHIKGHRRRIETNPGYNWIKVECPKCGKMCSNLKRHLKTHSTVRVRAFKCKAEGCGQAQKEMILPDDFPPSPGQSLAREGIQTSNDVHLGEINIGIKLEGEGEANADALNDINLGEIDLGIIKMEN